MKNLLTHLMFSLPFMFSASFSAAVEYEDELEKIREVVKQLHSGDKESAFKLAKELESPFSLDAMRRKFEARHFNYEAEILNKMVEDAPIKVSNQEYVRFFKEEKVSDEKTLDAILGESVPNQVGLLSKLAIADITNNPNSTINDAFYLGQLAVNLGKVEAVSHSKEMTKAIKNSSWPEVDKSQVLLDTAVAFADTESRSEASVIASDLDDEFKSKFVKHVLASKDSLAYYTIAWLKNSDEHKKEAIKKLLEDKRAHEALKIALSTDDKGVSKELLAKIYDVDDSDAKITMMDVEAAKVEINEFCEAEPPVVLIELIDREGNPQVYKKKFTMNDPGSFNLKNLFQEKKDVIVQGATRQQKCKSAEKKMRETVGIAFEKNEKVRLHIGSGRGNPFSAVPYADEPPTSSEAPTNKQQEHNDGMRVN